MTVTQLPHVPVLRLGKEYESLEQVELLNPHGGEPLARISQANAGLIRRDLKRQSQAAAALRAIPMARLLEICAEAGRAFVEDALPLSEDGPVQTPDEYVATLSSTSGMTHAMVRANMAKIHFVLAEMPTILRGLMRGMDPSVLDTGIGDHDGVPVSYSPAADSLGVILPSNSPGVNSIWLPSLALKTPVVLKPGREEPWTPLRIIRAFLRAGAPPEAFGFYPTSHEGSGVILDTCGRSQLFGDAKTTAKWAQDSRVELHGPGWSKILIGEDCIDDWEQHLDVLVSSVLDGGGRSCICTSAIFVPRHGDAIAKALAERIGPVAPRSADDPEAKLSAFANRAFAEMIDGAIEAGLAGGGATDACAEIRGGPRRVEHGGAVYLRPTVIRCQSVEHTLANTEYLFPFTSVVEVPQAKMLETIGHSLVVTAITRDQEFQKTLVASRDIDRLNLGPTKTTHVDWDQPHEGNLFESLWTRRAIRQVQGW